MGFATASSLAAPTAGLARFKEFEAFEAFGGSIRQFQASRKRKAWLATAASLAPEKEPLRLPESVVSQLQEPVWHVLKGLKRLKPLRSLRLLEGASGSFGPLEQESLGLPQPLVWHQKRNHLACHSL